MKQLTTYDELVAHMGKKVKFRIGNDEGEGKIQVDRDGDIFICQDLIEGADCGDKLGYKFSYYMSEIWGTFTYYNIFPIEEKKKTHTYETIYRRDDGVEFTETTIGGVSIEKLQEKEKELYAEAREIRSNLNAHTSKFKK